jgi:ribosomal protein S18 acetylase RimI-like enzyme
MSTAGKDIAANIYRFYIRVAELCDYDRGELAGCSYVWNRKGSWPSFLLGNPPPDSISEAIAAQGAGLVPPFWIMEKADPDNAQVLEDAGVRAIREWCGMELQADQFQTGASTSPSGAGSDTDNASGEQIVIRTNDPKFSSHWRKIVNEELLSGSQLGLEFLESVSRSDQFRWMVAFLDGRAVGTGLSYSENGVCGLYMIATVASYRGRGVGTRLTAELVSQAMAAGDNHFVLHATELGSRIYGKLGFREVNSFSVLWNLGR